MLRLPAAMVATALSAGTGEMQISISPRRRSVSRCSSFSLRRRAERSAVVPGKPYVLVFAEGACVGAVIVLADFSRFSWLEDGLGFPADIRENLSLSCTCAMSSGGARA